MKTIPIDQAVGTVLAHDITEIRPGEFKGPAFRKGHIVRQEDICRLQKLGKEHLFVLKVGDDELHENDAAWALAGALLGAGTAVQGEPKEGKVKIVALLDGLLKINKDALLAFNMVGEVMCATLHTDTIVRRGQTVAETRAIPLVIKKQIVEEAVKMAGKARTIQDTGSRLEHSRHAACTTHPASGVIEVRAMRKPRAGVVITGSEIFQGRIKDAFAPVISKKIEAVGGELAGVCYAPDDKESIVGRLRELLNAGADLLITTGGMSVDPDDVTRLAISELGASDIIYGSPVIPGAMFLIAYLASVPIIGIPACGLYANTTMFDLVLPRVLAGERIGRSEVAALGHGGLCMKCEACRYPVCPFGKAG
jgi:molybdenum cofactor synthesis domain-containing protein